MVKKGDTSVIIAIVLALVFMLIAFNLVFFVKDGSLDTATGMIDEQVYTGAYEENCTKLNTAADDFEEGALDTFDLTLEFEVDAISHFILFFDEGWGTFHLNEWYLDSWKITCMGTDGEVELMRYTIGTWVMDKTIFAKTPNDGNGADLGCGDTIKVHTLTGDTAWSGTNGDVYLCYLKDRRD